MGLLTDTYSDILKKLQGIDIRPEDDTTGLALWPATVICARWIANETALLAGKVVVELGAGCGLPGLASAVYGSPKAVYITDIHEPTLSNAKYNISLNGFNGDSNDGGPKVEARNVSWTVPTSYPPEKADVLLGSDLVYDSGILSVLCPAVKAMLKNDGIFLYVAPDDGRAGMARLQASLLEHGVECISVSPCPDHFYQNPLTELSIAAAESDRVDRREPVNEDEVDTSDHFVLHFYDLARKQPHTLYRFQHARASVSAKEGAVAAGG